MKLIAEQVDHPMFGSGVVTGQSQAAVTVRFQGGAGEKKFLYPSAFRQYLTLANPARQKQLEEEIAAAQAQQEAENQRRQALIRKQEELRQQRWEAERKLILEHKLEQKRAAAKKRQASREQG